MTKTQVEVVASVERRRRWSRAEKERIVAAAIEPGAVASEVARAAGIQASQFIDGGSSCAMRRLTSDERRRLLELLETADDGCAAELLLTLGFTPDLVLGVVRAGLATAQTENVLAGRRAVVVSRVRITDAGRLIAQRRD